MFEVGKKYRVKMSNGYMYVCLYADKDAAFFRNDSSDNFSHIWVHQSDFCHYDECGFCHYDKEIRKSRVFERVIYLNEHPEQRGFKKSGFLLGENFPRWTEIRDDDTYNKKYEMILREVIE